MNAALKNTVYQQLHPTPRNNSHAHTNPEEKQQKRVKNIISTQSIPHTPLTTPPSRNTLYLVPSSIRVQIRTRTLVLCSIGSRSNSMFSIRWSPHRRNITTHDPTPRRRRHRRSRRNNSRIRPRRPRTYTPRRTSPPSLQNGNLHLQILDLLLLPFTFSQFAAVYSLTSVNGRGRKEGGRGGTSIV